LRTLIYSFQTALKDIRHEKWMNILTILSISVSLLIISGFLTIILNIDSVLKYWSRGFGLIVYLEEGINKEKANALKDFFLKDPDILKVKYISKEQALAELRKLLGTKTSVLEELEENPLPPSFELQLKREALTPSLVEQKAAQIKQMTGVEEVQYGEKWLSSLATTSQLLKIGTLLLGCIISVAIIFITYTTIKIFFYRKKEEIETLKLLGATRGFIRLPFLMEGLFMGILSGIIASLILFGIYSFITIRLAEFLPSMRIILTPLPLKAYLALPPTSAILTFIGSLFAIGRIRY